MNNIRLIANPYSFIIRSILSRMLWHAVGAILGQHF